MLESVAAVSRLVRSFAKNTVDGYGGLSELYAIAELRRELDDVIDTIAAHLLANEDYSYREIGQALGFSRQWARRRYAGMSSRPSGGQPGNLR